LFGIVRIGLKPAADLRPDRQSGPRQGRVLIPLPKAAESGGNGCSGAPIVTLTKNKIGLNLSEIYRNLPARSRLAAGVIPQGHLPPQRRNKYHEHRRSQRSS
jgi:hypothetical protein